MKWIEPMATLALVVFAAGGIVRLIDQCWKVGRR